MAKITSSATLDIKVVFTINEEEARALDALAGYGDDEFIKMFYDNLGKSYMKPYENGMREFLKTIREELRGHLSQLDQARILLKQKKDEDLPF